jgi:catechol 2,3-dioxygenase
MPSLHPDTQMGLVSLTVADLERSLGFYQNVIGFAAQQQNSADATLGVNGVPLLQLHERKGARPKPQRATGLYHFAILMPTRAALGRSIRRLAETRYHLGGAADHLVSEAFYLDDPDGNGIELYRDRPRNEWPMLNGEVRMASDPIDLDGILGDAAKEGRAWSGLEAGTKIGHIHLQVADLNEAEKFYCGVLGFDLMQKWHGALFVSAGGYHHHLGLNTWNSLRGPRQPEDSAGLRYYTITLPHKEELVRVVERLKEARITTEEQAEGVLTYDPFGNGILLKVG